MPPVLDSTRAGILIEGVLSAIRLVTTIDQTHGGANPSMGLDDYPAARWGALSDLSGTRTWTVVPPIGFD